MIAAFRRRTHASLVSTLHRFWTAPASPRPLAWFRIGLASVLLVQALSLMGHLEDLYGQHGVVEWSVTSEDQAPAVPNLAWLEAALGFVGMPQAFAVPLAYAVYVGGLIGLLLGCRTRLAASLAWLAHTALMTSGEMTVYGVDQFAQIGLFYCLWFPVGHALSLDKAAGRVTAEPTFGAWLGLRMLQLHVCIAYLSSGVEKALGEHWWNGEAIWRAIMGVYDGPIDCSFLATVPWLSQGLCWLTLLLEAGVVLFIWHPRTRIIWLAGIMGMHLGIALVMNLWTFSATMIVFDIAAFGVLPQVGSRQDSDPDIVPPAAKGEEQGENRPPPENANRPAPHHVLHPH